jgi:deoxyadenosine/deoxycytidine kinase
MRGLGYIVVEGPIGVGKTSLARRLAESFGSELLLESPAENPFLAGFYREPERYALSTQLSFLLQRAHQLERVFQQDMFDAVRVADFLIEKDRLFAELTLSEQELEIYEQVYTHLTLQAPTPDLVIYLQAGVDVLLERVSKRGIDYERRIDRAYLERLSERYARFFHDYGAAPLLIVNAAGIDFVNNDEDYDALLREIGRMSGPRQYFNPEPLTS